MKADLVHVSLSKAPEILFYPTELEFIDYVRRCGLNRLKRPFIELYEGEDQAKLSLRPKDAFLFAVLASRMEEDGFVFYHAETGEWCTDEIPPKYMFLFG